jgi:two-component system, LuxR family, response regulator FixJ
MTTEPTVFIVDDDPHARESVRALVRSMGMPAVVFHSAEDFLSRYDHEPGCLITDYRMEGINGIEMQEELRRRSCHLPVIVVTAYARTQLTVRAMQNGAITLLDKPYDDDDLWQAIREALATDSKHRALQNKHAEIRQRLQRLTSKEHAVLDLIIQGKANKTMASELSVSLRTIENRRRSIFSKFEANSVAELVSLVLKLED